ncbi:hypothetical protein [Pseudonocardia endophytica]|uniref:hypothetical protein n=1 Tax=Pseudonocardia endophytica TaxID=401976 RepID=UPI00104D1EFA|nr:hypothetical protein [Pseudonocardia endophytica]
MGPARCARRVRRGRGGRLPVDAGRGVPRGGWLPVGPFHAVAHGLDTGDRALVASGRREIVDRLATASGR